MKKKIIILCIVVGVILLAVFASYNLLKKRSLVDTPFSSFVQQTIEQRYKDGKAIRVYLKTDVLDEDGFLFSEELNNLPGVNGTSFKSKGVQELMSENASLYPEKPGTLIPGSHVIIDVFVEDVQDKEDIIQQLKNYPQVESAVDIPSK